MAVPTTISTIRHPEYKDAFEDWQLWRDTYEGGWIFINRYLQRFTHREDETEFQCRKRMTPCPAFAKSAIDDIVNNIFQRMSNISRTGGSESYQSCLDGNNHGVDLIGSSMNYFIGKKVLPEMTCMKKVGVYIDMPPANGTTLLDIKELNIRPYLYMYTAEEIKNWVLDCSDNPNEYRAVLLEETYNEMDPKYMMPIGIGTRFRYMYINPDGYVNVEFYDEDDNQIWPDGSPAGETVTLPITRIPFVVFELPHSLLKDASRYQVALLNLLSSDINYCLKANFPFYTEQRDHRASPVFGRPAGSGASGSEGTEQGAKTAGGDEVQVGTASGRAYSQGLDRPGFIHPSPEPLKASMEKQEQMKAEIRLLINLAVTSLNPSKQASAESKGMDNQGLEAGLSAIGLELERGERKIAEFWAMYEESTKPATVTYPLTYSVKSDTERREEADAFGKLIPRVPSITGQREISKLAIRTLIGHKISREKLNIIEGEIDKAVIVANDPEIINVAVIGGFLDKENAAKACLYPDDAVAKANKEHAERIALIASSQSQAAGDPAARGVPDASTDPQAGSKEKNASKDSTTKRTPTKGVRGDGK